MSRAPFWIACAALAAVLAACNDVGDCPSPDSIVAGGSCSGDSLTCAYNLASPPPACDGPPVAGGIATSCVCTKGTWVCPAPFSCPLGDDGATPGDDGGDDGATAGDDGDDRGDNGAAAEGAPADGAAADAGSE